MSLVDGDKEALRGRMRAIRRAIPAGERARLAEMIAGRLFDLPSIRKAGTVLLFYSFGSEVSTGAMVERFLTEGRRVLLPFLTDPARMEAAELQAGRLFPTTYGPKEPAERVAVDPKVVDAVVAPGLAFDRSGHRLGYGGGHYDSYLARLGSHAVRTGIGFHVQVIDHVPYGALDQRLDFVVTDRETIECRSGDPS
jgi:5-formyltetrahydrofolate cyclo-ligase